MKKLFLLLAALITFSINVMAQDQRVTGVVVGADNGEPLVGATVMGVGTSVGTVTDIDGNFSLNIPAKVKKLSVSYVGMETKEVLATPGIPMTIALDNSNVLDEVITVAYGTAKRSAFTGSASVLDASEIESVQVSNPVEALKGKVSGVQLNSASGAPGSSPTIRIRGISSISAGNAPLIVVDGTPYSGDLNNISSQDIESMTVLKDAASNALYGARGANGVILITTKKGKGDAKVTFDAKWGSNQRATKDYDVITNPRQYYNTYAWALVNGQRANGVTDQAAILDYVRKNLIGGDTKDDSYGLLYNVFTAPEGEELVGEDFRLNPNATVGRLVTGADGLDYWLQPDSWRDEAYGNALRQEYNLSVSQANDRGSFYISASYLNNEGIVQNTNLERFTGRLSADLQAKPWLKVGANMSYTHFSNKALPDEGDTASSGNVFAVANQIAPIYPLWVRDGNGVIMTDANGIKMMDYGDGMNAGLTRPIFSNANPIQATRLDVDKAEGNAFNANGFAEIRFLRDFKFTTNNSVSVDETRNNSVTNPFYGMYATQNGMVTVAHQRIIDYTYQQLLNWTRQFGDHNLSVLLGHENYWQKSYVVAGNSVNMLLPSNEELSGAIQSQNNTSYVTNYNNEGWLGRANYDYNGKYFASASFRRDASSRFHPDHRWGSFWSLGGAWIISKESFFNAPWIDILKIKASYGEQGNDNIGNYRYVNTYTITGVKDETGALHPAAVPETMGNENITWEKNGNFNAGVDFSFWNERLSGTVEGFVRNTTDMLSFFPLPTSFGYSGYYKNVGNMSNRGFEIDLKGDIIRNKNVTWSANINMTWYKNKITKLPEWSKTGGCDGVQGYSSGSYFFGEGESLYTFRMPKWAGVDPETGVAQWWMDSKDENGKTIQVKTDDYSKATYHLCGTALPDVYGGFGTSVNAFGFDFSIDFTYQIGGQVYDSSYASLVSSITQSSRGTAIHKDVLKAWTPENKNSSIPRFAYGDEYFSGTSDRFLTSASYLALQSINFGYTLPSKITRKIDVDRVRIYMSADNVALWSKRQGLDPRQSITGAASNAYYAPIRTISGGINISF